MKNQIPLEVIALLFLMIMPLLALTLNGLVKLQFLSECWSMVIGKFKHIVEERIERQELAEKVAFYEKEFNINPLSWGKKKKKK